MAGEIPNPIGAQDFKIQLVPHSISEAEADLILLTGETSLVPTVIESSPIKLKKERGDRKRKTIHALLEPDETGKYFKYKTYREAATFTYFDIIQEELSSDERTKKINNYIGALLITRDGLIEQLEKLRAGATFSRHADLERLHSYVDEIKALSPPYENLTISQIISLLEQNRKAPLSDSLEFHQKREILHIQPLGQITKDVVMGLVRLDDKGKPVYSSARDPQLVRAVFDILPNTELIGKSFEVYAVKASIKRDLFVRRLQALTKGTEDAPTLALLNEIRASDPKYRKLTIADLIEMLNRKGPRKISKNQRWEYKSPTRKTTNPNTSEAWNTNNFREAFPINTDLEEITLIDTTSQQGSSKPGYHPKSPPVRQKPDKEHLAENAIDLISIPIPKFPRYRAASMTKSERLAYSLMLISDSRTQYLYPTVKSAVADIYREVLKKMPQEQKAESLESLMREAKKTIDGFIQLLKEYQAIDPDESPDPDVPNEIRRFVEWVENQTIYEAYTVEEIAKVLSRASSCEEVFETYKEFHELNEHAKNGSTFIAAGRSFRRRSQKIPQPVSA